jgi:class 3 adenylate cyclase/CheY-like chemotaxis protein/predicted metal-dependent HD superfamily phosphohydrolase
MERFINILIIDDNEKNQKGLKEILSGGGNNVLIADTIHDALPILQQKDIGILLINIDNPYSGGIEILQTLKEGSQERTTYKIVVTADSASGARMVKGLNEGAVDYITMPFNPNLIRAKIEVFKSLYHKDQRINQLLTNIFPTTVLNELKLNNKFSPRRYEQGVVLFTDFVDFSLKSRDINPIHLLKKLEYYFTTFDEIMDRYKLEKIKTIGDAYMALAGVTEANPEASLRACLAALEIRDFMQTEKDIAVAMNRDFWEIRIGIHKGPLVAGIIGTNKISFDVWGDSVNIAARAESGSIPGYISITKNIAQEVEAYLNLEDRGSVSILKRGGNINMFYLKNIKIEHCLYGEGKLASAELRKSCGLSPIDFLHMRMDILNRLKALLPDEVVYHDINHTLNVEKAAMRFARLEGLDDESIQLLRTAVLYHDAGFIIDYQHNESHGIAMAEKALPKFGYSVEHIERVRSIIASTASNQKPTTLLEQIMCDADHDYLGRADYFIVAKKLRIELENYGHVMSEIEWVEFQLNYLEKVHRFYTETAQNIRLQAKKARIEELKQQLNKLKKEQ